MWGDFRQLLEQVLATLCDRASLPRLTSTFEAHAQQTENGIEYWLARDLQFLLGYQKWDNFLNVISRAKTACEVSGHDVADHFADVGKMVDLGSGSQENPTRKRGSIETRRVSEALTVFRSISESYH